MKQNKGSTTLDFRKKLAAKTFSMTAYYDSMISNWFHRDQSDLVNNFSSAGRLSSTLRYGENPHQSAGLYKSSQHQSGIPYKEYLIGVVMICKVQLIDEGFLRNEVLMIIYLLMKNY